MKKFKVQSLKLKVKHLKNRIVFSILFLLLYSFTASSQETTASATINNNNIQIGQQVQLTLSVHYKVDNGKQIKIEWPELIDTIRKEIEIVEQTEISTLIPDSSDMFRFVQTKTLYITSFDSGYWVMPPFKFIVNGDTTGIFTEALLLQVNTIPVDTTLDIKDIKVPYEEDYSWIDWLKDNKYVALGIFLGIHVLLLIIYFIVKYFNKVKPPVVVVEAPKIPAHILAFEKLDKLKQEKLWQEGKLKLYHITLSEIIREYIENRFKIQALEQTTDEILFGFRNLAIDDESKAKLKQVLILSDLVKFAKEQPLPNENELSWSNAYDFVKGTMREEKADNKKES